MIETLDLVPAHLIGSSYRALTTLTCAIERPKLVRSLTLGEPPLLSWLDLSPEGSDLLETFQAGAFRPAAAAFAAGELEEGVRRFINGEIGPGVFDQIPLEGCAMMLDNAPEMRAETRTPPETYMPRLDPDEVGRLTVPVLLAGGEVSPCMFGVITDELARRLSHAERVTIPGASHGMHEENPDTYNAAVLNFLRLH